MAIMLTGPQRTSEERDTLVELAAIIGAVLMHSIDVAWESITAIYRMAGWECCAQAAADMIIADTFGWPAVDLPAV